MLVEPRKGKEYHTAYPPLALLKLAAHHKKNGDAVKLVSGLADPGFVPDTVYITSLFTYAYRPVHEVIEYYRKTFRKAEIVVGGIYATLCPDHLKDKFGDSIRVHVGLFEEVENILPDYSIVPNWDSSILFTSRGCIRSCHFCSVRVLEPEHKTKKSVKNLLDRNFRKAVLWDNNFLASPHWRDILNEFIELDIGVDVNQGLDARLITAEIANTLRTAKIPVIRLAYDTRGVNSPLREAIGYLKAAGFNNRRIIVYCLYNHSDSPEDFFARIKDLIDWGVVSYPMRFEPLEPRVKNSYVAPAWSAEQLEMVAKARRVIGYGGAFPPYDRLKRKFLDAPNFDEGFKLRPPKEN